VGKNLLDVLIKDYIAYKLFKIAIWNIKMKMKDWIKILNLVKGSRLKFLGALTIMKFGIDQYLIYKDEIGLYKQTHNNM
jgi:hypothetical protein